MANLPPNMTDYEQERRACRLTVPERFNFALDVVDRWASDDPGKLALLWVGQGGEERRLSFGYFRDESTRCANVLRALGITKGDGVLIVMPRLPAWHVILLGLIKLGAIPMPGTTLLTAKDIAYRVQSASVKMAITTPEHAETIEQAQFQCPTLQRRLLVGGTRAGWESFEAAMKQASPEIALDKTRSDDPLLVYFTSGTTAGPKMVLHTQASYGLAHWLTGKYWLDLRPTDLHWNLSDTGWAKAAYSNLFGPWHMGAALLIVDDRGKFDAKRCLTLLEKHEVTTFCAPPTAYRMMVLEDLRHFSLVKLRHCVGAGEPLNPEVIEAWRKGTGLTIYDGYGQTETVLLVANYRCLPVKPGSMGKPMPGFDVGVIDDDGQEVAPNVEGDIAVRVRPERPVGLFREYWRNPEATANCFRRDWYVTGDRAVRDADGYLWFVGRADDVIISAGYRIGPFEVESALVEHPAVAEAAVVASPDEMRGTVVKAFVILTPGYEPAPRLAEELQEHVKRVTAPYKYPREIEFVRELPKTISGKIRRVDLRQQEEARKRASQKGT
jgi:acetyl-CoA synthetase/medium-chain acyl-CoA synthetase